MTIIAYKDGVIASDGQTTAGGIIVTLESIKCFYSKGSVIGMAGDIEDMANLEKWFLNGMDDQVPSINEDSAGLLISPCGSIYGIWEGRKIVSLEDGHFHTIGSRLSDRRNGNGSISNRSS